jgi:hypothetical protein
MAAARSATVVPPKVPGWYWYWATEEELQTLTVEYEQIVLVKTGSKKGLLLAEFLREIRSVTKLKGLWSSEIRPK